MRVRISTQLALCFAVPIVALAVVVGAVFVGFNQMERSKAALIAKEAFRAHARDVPLQVLTSRYATRSFILSKQRRTGTDAQLSAIAKSLDDVTYLEAHTTLVPEASADVAKLRDAVNAISGRSLMLTDATTHDRAALLDAFLGQKDGKYAAGFA